MAEFLDTHGHDPELVQQFAVIASLQSAYLLSKEKSPSAADELVEQQIFLAQMLHDRREFLDALGFLVNARSILQDRGEHIHPLMSQVLSELGEHYYRQEMLSEALPYFDKALSIREALCLSENVESARLFLKTAEILGSEVRFIEAEQYLNRAYQILQEQEDSPAELLGDIAHNLGVVLLAKKEDDRALQFFKVAVREREKAYGAISEEVRESWAGVMRVSESNNLSELQMTALYKLIEIKEELHGPNDVEVNALKSQYRMLIGMAEPAPTPEPAPVSEGKSMIMNALLSAAILAIEESQQALAVDILKLSQKAFGNNASIDIELIQQLEEILALR